MTNQHKIGVFLCHCGGNISDVLKLDKIETNKALSLINSAIESVKYDEPLEKIPTQVKNSVLVIGAGISGITTAVSLAKQGMKVTLIEKRPAV